MNPTQDATRNSEEQGQKMNNVQQRMKQFVVENFYVSDPSDIREDTSLISTGLVDSTGMLEVIAFLESEFGISVRDQEMSPENLETIGRIAAYVQRKRAVQTA
jgi:acyl carrier protein